MGKYKGYSGNQHLRTDMDHDWRLIHDAKDDIYDEDRKLRDRKSAGHKEGVDIDTRDTGQFQADTEAGRDIGDMTDGGPVGERATEKVK